MRSHPVIALRKNKGLTSGVDIGGNPSAEDAAEDLDENTQQVIDVVYSFRLNETSFDKKSYLSHLKGA